MAFDGLSYAGALALEQVGAALEPAPESRISDWVEAGDNGRGAVILTAKTNTPREGPFSFEGVEYLREPLDRLHPDDPCSRVTIKGGAQSGKSSVGQLWVAWSIANNPKSFAIGLPAAGEIDKYNELKLQPIIDDSPLLKPRVRPVSTKSADGSKTRKKKLFNGASILLFNLASPNELQMISAGNLILEEVANALVEVGSRGAPIKQARERQAAYSVVGSKELMCSTPGELGDCEVTKAEEAGDQRRFYVECPHCAGLFRLEPENFRPAENGTPHHFVCLPGEGGCGGVLEWADMRTARPNGHWLATFPSDDQANPAPPLFIEADRLERWRARGCEGREPSYYVWQAYCGLISWDKIAGTVADAVTPADLKALEQQVYGRAWDPSVEALGWEELHKLCEEYEEKIVPAGAEIVTAFTDVQGSWLEGGAIAWGPGGEWWVIERWIIEGDTSADAPWLELDAYYRRTYRHADGGELEIEAFGVDTGYRTQKAYAFCRGRPRAFALDGRPGWKLPILGKPKPVKVMENGRPKGRVKLWPSGTWELKALLYWSLKISTEAGYLTRLQGRGHWSKREDEGWCQQITAEGLAEEKDARSGELKRWWRKLRDRNEWVDIWVGARALAWNLGVGAATKDGRQEAVDWAARAASRNPGAPQGDLFKAPKPAKPERASRPKAERPAKSDGEKRERRFFRRK